MKKCVLALSIAGIILFGQSLAQTKTFKLSDYKLPNLNRKAIDINFNLEGNGNYEKYSPDLVDPYTSNRSSFSSNTNVLFTSYLNSLTKQQQTYANFRLTSHINGQKSIEDRKYKSSVFHPYLDYNAVNRYYFKSDKFYEIDYRFTYGFNNNRSKHWEDEILKENTKYNSGRINLSLPLKIGKGRIEQVQDARQAIYILDELAKVDKIIKEINDEDILKLAAFISAQKNKRFFDSRLKRIAELEALDSFLQSNNFIAEIDSRYFTTLLDFWEYGGNKARNSGKRISFDITPSYSYQTTKRNSMTETEIDEKTNYVWLSGGLEYRRNKPISLKWQNDIRVYAIANLNKSKVDEEGNILKEKANNIHVGFVQSFAYHPNTRTSAMFYYSFQYNKYFEKGITIDTESDKSSISAYGGLEIDYYISPRFRFNFHTRLSYNWDKYVQKHNFNKDPMEQDTSDFSSTNKCSIFKPEFSLGLLYSIF